jgi:lysophospholipase L1-like esterase
MGRRHLVIRAACAAGFSTLCAAAPAAADPVVTWQIADRFRAITQESTEAYVARLRRYIDCAQQRRAAARDCADISRSAPGYGRIVDPNIGAARAPWDVRAYRYDPAWVHDQARDIRVRVTGVSPGARCSGRVEGAGADRDGPCEGWRVPARLGTHRLHVTVTDQGRTTAVEREITLRDLLVVNLGDSVASGEGNPHHVMLGDYPPATCAEVETPSECWREPALWLDHRCNRSLLSAAGLASAFFAASAASAETSVTYLSFACSGARSDHVVGEPEGNPYDGTNTFADVRAYRDKFGDPDWRTRILDPIEGPLPPQIGSLRRALVCPAGDSACVTRRPDHVFLSVGANDVGFVEIVMKLVLDDATIAGADGIERGPASRTRREITELVRRGIAAAEPNLDRIAAQLAALGTRRVTLLAYPNPVRNGRGGYCDANFVANWWFGGLTRITAVESRFAESTAWRPLNDMLRRAATRHAARGWSVDTSIAEPTNADRRPGRRGFCAAPTWWISYDEALIRQGVIRVSGRGFPTGTLHPNIFAHNALAERLVRRMAEPLP